MLFGKAKANKVESLEEGQGGIQDKRSYLDNAVALRSMKLHPPAPDR